MTDTTNAEVEAFVQRTVASGVDLRDASRDVAAQGRARIEELRADARLSEHAKAADIREIQTEVNAKRAALEHADEAQRVAEADSLRRSLCSPPETPYTSERIARDASYRDAMERARRTDPGNPDELAELFRSATMMSDSLQQRAAMTVALERKNDEVLNGWATEHPFDLPKLQRLVDLTEEPSRQKRLTRHMHFARVF